MRLLWALILCLSLAPRAAPQPIDRAVRVVFVQVPGEAFDPAMVETARQSAQAAADWWHDLSPVPTTLTITDTAVISTSADVFADLDWLIPYLQDDAPALTIWVLNNSSTLRLLWGDAIGTASSAYGGFVIATYRGSDLAATIAHELGHALYRLPDQDRSACHVDIMCTPGAAYHMRMVGCVSLEVLGAPCRKVWMPVVRSERVARSAP